MIVKYSWMAETSAPHEITAIEIEDVAIPRQGDLVEIALSEKTGTRVNKSGRVKDVIWSIRETTGGTKVASVTVILGR